MPKTVLVVDDEKDIRTTIKTILQKNGYKVFTAVDGDDCLKQIKKHKIDLVLLDIMMPGTPIKKIVPKIKGSKIAYVSIVQTSNSEREYMLKQKNVMGFIQKPFEIDDLIRSVKKILEK